ncbi:MAG: alpha/beta hydrolase [Bacteroidota bacterium]
MKSLNKLLLIGLVLITSGAMAKEKIKFKSKDGLEVVADLYMAHPKTAPFIVLFHQANWSRGEYQEIAPKLNAMGYNCMAVDQRSGGTVNGVKNETKVNAQKALKQTSYVDAIPDMIASIEYAKSNLSESKLIIWGSSYSSALVLKLAGDMPDAIDAALAFAPGEYFSGQGKPKDFVTQSAKNITKPVFITSAKNEKGSWWKIYEAIPEGQKHYFLPSSAGNHGSRALWEKFSDSKHYWDAVTAFLESV